MSKGIYANIGKWSWRDKNTALHKKKKKAFEVHTHIYNKLDFANILWQKSAAVKERKGLGTNISLQHYLH